MSKQDNVWMHISDMMSTLMMIFMFIAIVYMIDVTRERDRMVDIADTYNKLQGELYADLNKEFSEDLEKWNAVIDRELLSIRFQEPDVLFDVGSSRLKVEFKNIIEDFFPRYIRILTMDKYINNIEEIRIEGHTSTEWGNGVYGDVAYIRNMKLSQDRTREVLGFCLYLLTYEERSWVQERLTANGLSSSRIIYDANGVENKKQSRRVEFRVKTNADKVINEIINTEK